MSGVGFYACVGRWARPSVIYVRGSHVRIVLGWVCMCFMAHDTDLILGHAIKAQEAAKTARFATGGVIQPKPALMIGDRP